MISKDRQSNKDRKLILHVDIRNTVFAADSVGHMTVEEGINSYLTGVAWGEVDGQTKQWRHLSNQPSLKPPNQDAVCYYNYLERTLHHDVKGDRIFLRQVTKNFTKEEPGRVFSPILSKCLEQLKWKYSTNGNITTKGHDGTRYHYVLPSFLNLINQLAKCKRKFAIIFRTYGIDAMGILKALQATANKRHPSFPNGIDNLSIHNVVYKLKRENGEMVLVNSDDNTIVCNGEESILHWISSSEGVKAIQDDFNFWKDSNYSYIGGKPFWIPNDDDSSDEDEKALHIFIDDNIRHWETDSIVNFRKKSGHQFIDIHPEEYAELENVYYFQADLIDAICDSNYFIQRIADCEQNVFSNCVASDLQ